MKKPEPFGRGAALTGMETTTKAVHVTEKNFESTVERGIVLLDFWASWCGPCRTFGPVFEAAAKRHPDVVFGKVDTDAEAGLAGAFQIRAIPTVMVLRDGVVLAAQSGALSAAALDELVRKVKAIDMSVVRRSLDELEPAARVARPGGA